MKHVAMLALLILVAGCSDKPAPTPAKGPEPEPKASPKPTPDPKPNPDPKRTSDPKSPPISVTEAEKKAASAFSEREWTVTVDEKHPDKPVIGLDGFSAVYDEPTAALLNELKHLRSIRGLGSKMNPGVLKLLKNHPSLDTIEFGGKTNPDVIKELPEGPALKEVRLANGQYTAEHFETIAKLPSIKSVRVQTFDAKNPVIADILRPLYAAKNLESLAFGYEPLTPEVLAGFSGLKSLECKLPKDSDPLFDAMAKLKSLRSLKLLGLAPVGLSKLATVTELTELQLLVSIGDADLKTLGTLKNLDLLELLPKGVTAEGIKALQAFPKLTTLTVVGKLDDSAVAEFKGLKQLKHLALPLTADTPPYGMALGDAGASAIGSLSELESLDVTEFKLGGVDKLLPHLAKLTKLRELKLSFKDLEGAKWEQLAKELATLKQLEFLVIPGFNFDGTSPEKELLQKSLPKVKIRVGESIRI